MSKTKPHQSAVKDIEVVILPSDDSGRKAYTVLTVGDDNALAVTVVRVHGRATDMGSTAETLNLEQASLLVPHAHAASATAVALLSIVQSTQEDLRTHALRLATTSADQRLRSWEVAVDLNRPECSGINIRLIGDVSSAVADASSLCMLTRPTNASRASQADQYRSTGVTDILLCGVGMEHWTI